MRVPDYIVSYPRVRQHLDALVRADRDTLATDRYVRNYYGGGGPLLWVSRHGACDGADTLLAYLHKVDSMGFSQRKFGVRQIEDNLRRLRRLDFDTIHTASRVVARLDYLLTKYYLRYATGQRFGYFNPRHFLNRLDLVDTAQASRGYRTLYDVGIDVPGRLFFTQALSKVGHDSVGIFLHEIQPADTLDHRLGAMLCHGRFTADERTRILVNMERRRWRTRRTPGLYGKYVVVNVPSFTLTAVDAGTVLSMRVGLGAVSTKTPLLDSDISRMDINPQWIVPKSIIRHSIARHAGDSAYFARNHYFVRERSTGRTVACHNATADMLLSSQYAVVQKGGEGNSLGRIIFRFPNSFSVYLHDTPSRSFFSRPNRAVSHGCIRVERPYDLAAFLLSGDDDADLDKIHYSMTAHVGASASAQTADTLRRRMMIGSKKVTPVVPLFVTYYTLYPNHDGVMQSYPDVYGYDAVIAHYLDNFR